MHSFALRLTAIGSAATVMACAGTLETERKETFALADARRAAPPPASEIPELDGSLAGYLAAALERSPETRVAFERWRAAVYSISGPRRLPESTLTFGYFIRSVETRVGPQRFRVGLSQMLPWPTALSAGSDAMAERAQAAELVLRTEMLAIKRDVALAYWDLWMLVEEHHVLVEHDAVLESLAGSVRGRMATGAASLADLSQVELSIARHHDHTGSHVEAIRKASARLLAAIGVEASVDKLKVTDDPVIGMPVRSPAELRAQLPSHPHLERFLHLSESEELRAKAERARRYPSLRLGVEYIETGAAQAMVPDSGKDPIIVSAGISVPLDGGSYSDASRAARAAAAATEAEREVALRQADAALVAHLSELRDASRRIELIERTLVPQAETTLEAVLGSYQTGRSSINSVILAQRELIELRGELVRARGRHARAWAELEYTTATELERRGAQ